MGVMGVPEQTWVTGVADVVDLGDGGDVGGMQCQGRLGSKGVTFVTG